MPSLDARAGEWPGAVIVLGEGGETFARPAAFVFDTPDGFAWIEPSYADPHGASSPAFHRRAGTWDERGVLLTPAGWASANPYDPAEDRDIVGDAIDWFADRLKAEGRSWADERERVRALVAEALA